MPTVLLLHSRLTLGGLLRLTSDRIEPLQRAGFRVIVGSVLPADGSPQVLAALSRFAGQGVRAYDFAHGTRGKAVTTASAIRRVIRSEAVDIVHCDERVAEVYGGLAGRSAGARVVREFIGTGVDPRFRWVRRRLAHRSVALSQSVAASQCGAGIEDHIRTDVVYPAFDSKRHQDALAGSVRAEVLDRLGVPATARVLLYIGRLSPAKGIMLLPEVVARLDLEYVNVVVGDGGGRQALELEIAARGLSNRFHLLGAVADPSSYLTIADVLLAPTRAEASVSYTVLEAFAAKVPVVVSDLSSTREVLVDGESAFLVHPTSPNAWAEAVQRLRVEEARSRMIEGGLRVLKLYDPDVHVEELAAAWSR